MIRQGFPFNCQSDLDLIRSKYYQSLLKVSWQLIESCVKKQQGKSNDEDSRQKTFTFLL